MLQCVFSQFLSTWKLVYDILKGLFESCSREKIARIYFPPPYIIASSARETCSLPSKWRVMLFVFIFWLAHTTSRSPNIDDLWLSCHFHVCGLTDCTYCVCLHNRDLFILNEIAWPCLWQGYWFKPWIKKVQYRLSMSSTCGRAKAHKEIECDSEH